MKWASSPVPIIAVILMLLSRKATSTSTGLLLGWVAGVVVVTVVVLTLVGQAGDSGEGTPSTLSSVLKLVSGVLLLLMALWQWQGRPKEGETGAMPKWMGAIESFTFGRALGLGFLLSGVNPKNLLLCLGAGTHDRRRPPIGRSGGRGDGGLHRAASSTVALIGKGIAGF